MSTRVFYSHCFTDETTSFCRAIPENIHFAFDYRVVFRNGYSQNHVIHQVLNPASNAFHRFRHTSFYTFLISDRCARIKEYSIQINWLWLACPGTDCVEMYVCNSRSLFWNAPGLNIHITSKVDDISIAKRYLLLVLNWIEFDSCIVGSSLFFNLQLVVKIA